MVGARSLLLLLCLLATAAAGESPPEIQRLLSDQIGEAPSVLLREIYCRWIIDYPIRWGGGPDLIDMPLSPATLARVAAQTRRQDAAGLGKALARYRLSPDHLAALAKAPVGAADDPDVARPKIILSRYYAVSEPARLADIFPASGVIDEGAIAAALAVPDIEPARRYLARACDDRLGLYLAWYEERHAQRFNPHTGRLLELQEQLPAAAAARYGEGDPAPIALIWLIGQIGSDAFVDFLIDQSNRTPTLRHAISLGACLSASKLPALRRLNDKAASLFAQTVMVPIGAAGNGDAGQLIPEVAKRMPFMIQYCALQSFPK